MMRFDIRNAMVLILLSSLGGAAAAQSGAASAGAAASAASPLKRTQVYKGPVAAADHEAVLVKAELAPGGHAGRHTHPGDEISYVVDGDAEIVVDGQPPLKLKAGQGFSVPAGKVHDLRNDGKEPVHLIGVYVVEKGKPLATPAK
jgi:quercetin dioxygenase-like cupin family protein